MKTTRTLLSLSLLLSTAGTLRAMDTAADASALINAETSTPATPAEESPASKRIRELQDEKTKLATACEARRNSLTGHEAEAAAVEQALLRLERKKQDAESALEKSTTSFAKQETKAMQKFAEALEAFRAAQAANEQALTNIRTKRAEATSAYEATISEIAAEKAAQMILKTNALKAAQRSSAEQQAHEATIADFTKRQERLAAGKREVPALFGLLQ